MGEADTGSGAGPRKEPMNSFSKIKIPCINLERGAYNSI